MRIRNPNQLLSDILTNIEAARHYIGTSSLEAYESNQMMADAIEKRLQNASEAARWLHKQHPADSLEERFFEAFEKIALFPGIDHRWEDLSSDENLRFFSIGRFLIVYRERHGIAQIARILGGAQNIARLLIMRTIE